MANSKEVIVLLPEKPPPLTSGNENPRNRWFWQTFNQYDGDLDKIATQPSVFDNPLTLEVYRPPPQYENSHRFDPNARWTWGEESAIVQKTDIRIMILASLMMFALDLDTSSMARANTDNFLQDLHLTTNDLNLGLTLNKVSYLIAEFPSQLISKRIGPDVWIPTQIILWSLVSISQFWLTGRTSFLATRTLAGFLSGGFIPNVVLYLSYFYTKRELPIRLAWLWATSYLSVMIGAFVATGVLLIHSGHGGWRFLFLIEGLVTLSLGIVSTFFMPPGPTQTKAWLRPHGWFTEREEIIMVNRLLRDDPTKSDMHNRQSITLPMIWKSVCDWRMWPLYILGLLHLIPITPPQTYLTLIFRRVDFTTTQTNLLTLPGTIIGFFNLLIVSYFSERIQSRILGCLILQIWALPLLIALWSFGLKTGHWDYYAVVTLIAGSPTVTPIPLAWASRNSGSVRTRFISTSLYTMCVQAGLIVSANLYRKNDAPLYKKGNIALILICAANMVLYLLTFIFYRAINRWRDRKWDAMTEKEQADYLKSSKDEGNDRLDFRFVY